MNIPPELRIYGTDLLLLVGAVVAYIRYGCFGVDPAADWRAIRDVFRREKR